MSDSQTKDAVVAKNAIDTLGVALADHKHIWSDEQREAYEKGITATEHLIAYLNGHCPPKE